MRVILATAAALIAVTLSGCDINTGPPKTAKVECNCAAPVAAPPAGISGGGTTYAPPPERHYRWHRHPHSYAHWSGHSYYWRREYSEVSVQTYDYHSTSTSTYTDGGTYGGGDAYASGEVYGDGGYHTADRGWIDGYGRSHDGGATTGEPVHYETHGGGHSRGDVWHGYDVDCPDPAQHH